MAPTAHREQLPTRRPSWRPPGRVLAGLVLLTVTGCNPPGRENAEPPTSDAEVYQTLAAIGLDATALSVPKLGPMAVSHAARLPIVDRLMSDPLEMRHLGERLVERDVTAGRKRDYFASLLGDLRARDVLQAPQAGAAVSLDSAWRAASADGLIANIPVGPPAALRDHGELSAVLAGMIGAASTASQEMRAMLAVTDAEWRILAPLIRQKLAFRGDDQNTRWLTERIFHTVGARMSLNKTAQSFLELVAAVEAALPPTTQSPWPPGEWMTPLGRLRIGSRDADHYQGEYFAILDPGGNDTYEDVAAPLRPGSVLVVVDLDGNDAIGWHTRAGPGAGVLGYSLWLDAAGDDSYVGNNVGAGAAVLGAGVLWDRSGNDRYEGGSLAQGAANYGIAILLDEAGSDSYRAGFAGQGFGGPAGFGVLIDAAGDDRYACGDLVPDRVEARRARHGAEHFLSMCQGFAFGFRPEVSGGFGALLDRAGNDQYRVDIFGQGAAFWFGAGMLTDRDGDDRYEAFEHCQGESVHLGAGFLGDWNGNDRYSGFEHCQGVGVDRAAGFLYDQRGDDTYSAERDAQGAGLKAFAVGILWDASGADRYRAAETAQGIASLVDPIPEDQLGVGILLDNGKGTDVFELAGAEQPGRRPRIRNRQGIAANR